MFIKISEIRACDKKKDLSFPGRFGDFGIKDASDWFSTLISAPDCKQILSFQPCLSKQGKAKLTRLQNQIIDCLIENEVFEGKCKTKTTKTRSGCPIGR